MFDLHGKVALLIGPEGNLGPIWKETLEEAGSLVELCGLPTTNLSDQAFQWYGCHVPDIIICNAAIDTPPSISDAR